MRRISELQEKRNRMCKKNSRILGFIDCHSETLKSIRLASFSQKQKPKSLPLFMYEVEYCTKDAIKQSDSYGWIWTSGSTSITTLRTLCGLWKYSLRHFFHSPLQRILGCSSEHANVCMQANTESQPVSAGEHPPAHLLTADNAYPAGNTETVRLPQLAPYSLKFHVSLV